MVTVPDEDDREQLFLRIAQVVRDRRVIEAMRAVPREWFLPEPDRRLAYEDSALPIGEGQTISQPSLVAIMTEALAVTGTDRVLEVGTGSGYQAAILSRLAAEVVSVEVVDSLRERAQSTLARLGVTNVRVLPAGAVVGAPAEGPYDAIVVTAAAPAVPPALVGQLGDGGRLVIPVGSRDAQRLLVVQREGAAVIEHTLGDVRFVPLRGSAGFRSDPSQ